MRDVMTNSLGLSVLAALHLDRVMALAAVSGALLAGGWLCMAALAIH